MGSAAAAATASSAGKRWTESNKLVAPEVENSQTARALRAWGSKSQRQSRKAAQHSRVFG